MGQHTPYGMVALAVVGALVAPCLGDESMVKTTAGWIKGEVRPKSRRFMGIPYATPPLGELRWRDPTPHAAWSGVREAVDFGPVCLQNRNILGPSLNYSEDCLSLNVYTQRANSNGGKLLPVMVWIHGGGYVFGASDEPRLNGTWVAELAGDVVIVTMNYRLGIFGYLGSERMRSRTSDGSTGNFGMADQRLAIKWVNENIKSFGGDPKNIMIYGESAGAGSVSVQLVYEGNKGLFQKAVMESGGFTLWSTIPMSISEQLYNNSLSHFGCSNVDCMVKQDAEELLKVSESQSPPCRGYLYKVWAPVIDGVALPKANWQLASEGRMLRVPIIIGTNRDEGASFGSIPTSDRHLNQTVYDYYMDKVWGPVKAPQVGGYYPPSSYPKEPYCSQQFLAATHPDGDSIMSCPAYRTALSWVNLGLEVYVYVYDHPKAPQHFVQHAMEIPYVFYALPLLDGAIGAGVSRQFVAWWTAFAHSSNPNTPRPKILPQKGRPEWTAFATTNGSMLINVKSQFQARYKSEACGFWATQVPAAYSCQPVPEYCVLCPPVL